MGDIDGKQQPGKPAAEYIEHDDLGARILDIKCLHDGQGHNNSDHHLVVDVKEAEKEYGREVAAALKTTEDGMTILWPQPRDDPHDPLNASESPLSALTIIRQHFKQWSDFKKHYTLAIISLATIIPAFCSSIGIASLFPLSVQFNTTVAHVNNL
ncbi:hypothetical protein FS749_014601 [Ceratobasidium sp. UAMH 11750]|nr:hypothetical protein FS749_014601 [Ceratobasidium sp. UAMH 11750]